MPFGLGFFATVGAGAAGGPSFDLLETQLVSSQTSSITFSSLSSYASTYQHLQIRMTVRGTRAANGDGFSIRFNGDTATNYSRHGLNGFGSTTPESYGVANQSYGDAGACPGTSSPGSTFAGTVLDILDAFETTKFKTIRTFSGQPGTQFQVGLSSGNWRSTNAISSITLFVQSGNDIAANSRLSLYGIKAA